MADGSAYLKKETEMMIDANAGGLHIDEYDSQKHVFNNAGCFCPECVDKFRRYLKEKRISLPADAGELKEFDYRAYLLQKGYGDRDLVAGKGNKRWEIPLFREYARMQMDSICGTGSGGACKSLCAQTAGRGVPRERQPVQLLSP